MYRIIALIFILFSVEMYGQLSSESFMKSYAIELEKSSAESLKKTYSINRGIQFSESNIQRIKINPNSNNSNKSFTTYYSIRTDNESNISVGKKYCIGYSKESIVNHDQQYVSATIPKSLKERKNVYALIIGNEDYKSFQTGLSSEQNVDFAISDAKLFKNICNNTLGVPIENIIYVENGSFVKMKQSINQIELICKNSVDKPTILFYYSGHGLPDEETKTPYLIPVDVSGSSMEFAISLPELYKSLTSYQSEKTIVFLDACFTGGARNSGLIASRGIRIVPKEESLKGNLVVFSSSSEKQSSKSYYDKRHGLFTYFLTQKLIESKGEVNLGELDEYLQRVVPIKSILINKTEQNPKTNISANILDEWKNWKIE